MFVTDLFGIMEHDLLQKGQSRMDVSSEKMPQEDIEEVEKKLLNEGYQVRVTFVEDGYILQAWSNDVKWH